MLLRFITTAAETHFTNMMRVIAFQLIKKENQVTNLQNAESVVITQMLMSDTKELQNVKLGLPEHR